MNSIIDILPKMVKPGGFYDEIRALAFHEASHALVILKHGRCPDYVSLSPPGTKFNHKRIAPDFALQLHMAGAIGQGIYSGEYGWSDGDRKNLIRVIALNRFLFDEVLRIWRQTHHELLAYWEWIWVIANNLYRQGRLNKDYFKRLMT